ncbi:hypothetical protein BVX93_01595 [bacterium B13(2017)]|nr:hypothetical protein BVX93_01595 [bacterium B13(2017)]
MKIDNKNDLNLPDAPDFISKPPKITQEELIKQCEQMLPHWNKIRLQNPQPQFNGKSFRFVE